MKKESDQAKELFTAWDVKMSKFLTIEDVVEKLTSIGLSVDQYFIRNMMKHEDSKILSMIEFLNVFKHDRFGNRVCKVMASELLDEQKEELINAVNKEDFSVDSGYGTIDDKNCPVSTMSLPLSIQSEDL
jgi:hypothetical protein